MPSSSPPLQHRIVSGFAARAIAWKAQQLAGHNGFSRSEREDIEQELRLHLLRRLAKFDPEIAHWNVFVRTVLERRAASLIAQRRAALQAGSSIDDCASLDDSRIDLAIDTAAILARLPRKSRQLCERLKRDSIAEVARQEGLPRTTLRDRVERLRKHFVAVAPENFSEFARHFSSDSGR